MVLLISILATILAAVMWDNPAAHQKDARTITAKLALPATQRPAFATLSLVRFAQLASNASSIAERINYV